MNLLDASYWMASSQFIWIDVSYWMALSQFVWIDVSYWIASSAALRRDWGHQVREPVISETASSHYHRHQDDSTHHTYEKRDSHAHAEHPPRRARLTNAVWGRRSGRGGNRRSTIWNKQNGNARTFISSSWFDQASNRLKTRLNVNKTILEVIFDWMRTREFSCEKHKVKIGVNKSHADQVWKID